MWVLALFVLTAAGLSEQINFLSHTYESIELSTSQAACPDSPHDLEWIGAFNITTYRRQPHLEHLKHRRVLDQSSEAENDFTDQHGARLQAIYTESLLLPSLAIQNGLSNLGDTRRLERALFKLVSGQPVTIVALGGSVTVGHGPENQKTAWVPRVFEWINATFPHPGHMLLNKAIPAVTSSYIAPCVLDLIPEGLDLVLLEFTFNDGERSMAESMEDPTRRGLERLVRKLMRMDSRPAILNLHYHPFNIFSHYWDGAQDRMEMLLKYYGVTSLSMRSGLHRLMAEPATSWLKPRMWPGIDVHPTCVGYKFMSSLVIGFFQDFSAFVLQTFHSQQHLPHAEVLLDQLPAPLFEGNTADGFERCILGDDFKALENGNRGWQWLDEGKRRQQHKWGFISWRVGEAITLKVPVQEMPIPEDRKIMVALGVLMSYEHNGWLSVDCVNGCSCKSRLIHSLHPIRYSMTYWKTLEDMTLEEGSSSCELYIQNADLTNSGEHKVKLTSLLLSSERGSFIESWKFE